MHYISLQERSSQRDKADELSLLTWLGSDESGIDKKAAVDFKHTSWSCELRALLWKKWDLLYTGTRSLQREPHRQKLSTGQELKATKYIHLLQWVGAGDHQSQPHCGHNRGECWITGWKGPAGGTSLLACYQDTIHISLKVWGNWPSLHYSPCWFIWL